MVCLGQKFDFCPCGALGIQPSWFQVICFGSDQKNETGYLSCNIKTVGARSAALTIKMPILFSTSITSKHFREIPARKRESYAFKLKVVKN